MLQERVAGSVPEIVVDPLEAVHVERGAGERVPMAPVPHPFIVTLIEERAPVEQTREWIVARQLAQATGHRGVAIAQYYALSGPTDTGTGRRTSPRS